MQRMKRVLASILCVVMLFTSVPLEAFATETTNEPQSTETTLESTIDSGSDMEAAEAIEVEPVLAEEETGATEEVTEPTEEETEPTEEETEPTEEETEPTEEETEPTEEVTEPTEEETEPTEEETEPTEEETDPTEEETEPTEEETEPTEEETEPTEETTEPTESVSEDMFESDSGWVYTINDQGYAVILGYTDYSATSLSIPYAVDGYFVAAIGEKAFVNNTFLSQMYVHGNVQEIASNAFEGLGLKLTGYNGTKVLEFASAYGYSSTNLSNNSNLTFVPNVVDFSYTASGRYDIIDNTTLQMGQLEASQLLIGSVLYLPEESSDGLIGLAYEVTSISGTGDWVTVTVETADPHDVLMRITVEDDEMMPDWDNAEWAEGVTVVQEKIGGSKSGSESVNLTFSKKKGPATFSVSGTLGVKVEGKIDYDLWHNELKECSVIVNPHFTIKGGVKVSGDANQDDYRETSTLYGVEVYLGKVPVISVVKLMSVDFAVYMKVEASGEVEITFKLASGKAGVKWNRAASKFEGVWEMEKPSVSLDVKGEFEIGPAMAFELNVAIIGEVMSIEAFKGLHVEVAWSTKHVECFDLDVDDKRSLEYKVELDLSDIKEGLSWGHKITIFDRRVDLFDWHYEIGKGKVSECTYDSVYVVDFCTFTNQKITSQKLNAEEKVKEPNAPTLSGNKFLGWYTSKDYSTAWNFDTPVTEDLTLYAKWDKSSKTVLFNKNCDDTSLSNWTDECMPGSKVDVPQNIYRFDYILDGWFTDAACTTEWDFSYDVMPDDNLTLYAGWTYEEGYDPYEDASSGSGAAGGTITGGKMYYGGHVYEHIATYVTFAEAQKHAESVGGYLMTITSEGEENAILKYVQQDCAQDALWLGINNTTDWAFWLNGEKVIYENWHGGTDVDEASQYNGTIIRTSGQWIGVSNSETRHYVIEWGDYEVAPDFPLDLGDVNYAVDSDSETVSVTGIGNNADDVVIDNIHEGQLVTAIEERAFQDNITLRDITIPNTITTIGDYAFSGCANLEEIVIPDSVTDIGTRAFENCTSLRKVTLPSTMTVLPDYMFYGCTSLEEVVYLDRVVEIGAYAFYNCAALNTVVFNDQLTTIGASAFYGCSALANITLPNTLTSLGTNAFRDCTNLANLVIPSSLTSLPRYAFGNCTGLTDVTIPKSITSIGSSAFLNVTATFKGYSNSYAETWCDSNDMVFLAIDNMFRVRFVGVVPITIVVDGNQSETGTSEIYVAGGTRLSEPVAEREGYELEGWYTDPEYTNKWDFAKDVMPEAELTLYAKWDEIDESFAYIVEAGEVTITGYNGASTEVTIPEKLGGYPVVKIAALAFNGNDTIRRITLPKTLTTIEAGAFRGCTDLFTIALSVGNTSFIVRDGILYSADSSNLIYMPEGRTIISLVVPGTVTTIFSDAFSGQSELARVEIPDSVITIGENAFPTSSMLTLYGSVGDCAAKRYAENNGLSYNTYRITFFEGNEAKYSATWQAGTLIDSYYEPIAEFAKFGGWYTDIECTIPWNFETDLMPASNLSLYLKWNSDFEISVSGESVTITGYTGTLSDIIIPTNINGYAVTGIAAGAIISRTDAPITSVTIPATVTTIESGAITGTPVPQVVGDVGSAAEAYATNSELTFEIKAYTVTFDTMGGAPIAPVTVIPGELLSLPTPIRSNYRFMGWYTSNGYSTEWTAEDVMPAKDMTLYAYWKIVNSNVDNAFTYEVLEDGTLCITQYAGTKISLAVPETINGMTVTAIGDYAFRENSTLLTVSLPDTVTSIGSYAFANSSVRSVNAKGVKHISESCFSGAAGLTEINFLDQVSEIPDSAFRDCESLTTVVIPESVTYIGDYAFYGCDYLSSVVIPEMINGIGTSAFAECNKLTAVEVPATLKELNEDVFGANVSITYTATSTLKILKLKQITKNSVSLEWNEVEGADGYYLYRKQGTAGTYSLIKTVTETSTSNYSLTPGITYYYKLQAYTLDGSTKIKGVESAEVAITISTLTTPEILNIEQASATTATMIWSKVNGAEGYEVHRSYSQNGDFTCLKSIDTTKTINTGLVSGATYYYKVRAFATVDNEVVYSAWSDISKFTMPVKFMDAPTNLTVRMTAPRTVNLKWDRVEGADGYDIYRQTENGTFTLIKSIVENETYNYNLTIGRQYGYRVSAYYYNDGSKISGECSTTVSVDILTVGTPYIKSVTQSAAGTALVKWSSVGSADGYELYRCRTENGKYALMKSVTGIETSNYNLSIGGTYYYKVRAYTEDENGNFEYGAFSAAVPITISDVAQTRIKSVTQVDGSSAKVIWATLRNAERYEVWRSTGDNLHYELVRDTSGTAIQDRNLNDGMTYYYKIRAYKLVDEIPLYGTFSEELCVKIISAPQITLLEQVGAGINEVMWSKVTSADGYELWSSTTANGTYEQAKDVTLTTTTVSDVAIGTTYYYKVRAYYLNGENRVYSNYSDVKCVKVIGIPEITYLSQNGANAVNISWNAAEIAEGYELYKSTNAAGPYEKVKNVTGTSTGNYNLEEGGKYYYKLRGYVTVNGKKQYGPYCASVGITLLNTPVITFVEQADSNSATISWDEVEGATSYKLYRSTNPDSGFSLVKTVADTTTTNYSLTQTSRYYYKLKAVTEANGVKYESAYSSAVGLYITDLSTPKITGVVLTDASTIVVTWNDVEGAESYHLYRSATEDGVYELVQSTTGTTYTDTNVTVGSTYCYKLRASETVEDETVYTAYSSVVGATSEGDADNVHWKLSGSILTLSGEGTVGTTFKGNASITKVVISDGITAIASNAFSGCTALKTVSVANTVTEIGNYAFYNCTALKELLLVDGLTTIGEYAFSNCTSLTSVDIPDTATSVGVRAFENCTALNNVFIPAELQHVSVYHNQGASATGIFNGCTNLANVTFEEGTDYIHAGLFAGSGIKAITIPETVTEIGGYAFSNCTSLTTVSLSEGLTSIGTYAFSNSTKLNQVEIPGTVTSIGAYAFNGCSGLSSIKIPASVTTVGNYAFYNCSSLKRISMADGLTTIGEYAFSNCTSLTSVDIPDTATSVGVRAFENCTALNNVFIPAELQHVSVYHNQGASATGIFNGCTNLANVTFEEGTDYIHAGLFAGSGIKAITIPETVTEIGGYAFSNCTSLTTVSLSEGLTSIGTYAFSNSTKLNQVEIPGTVTSIGAYAFNGCSGLSSIKIPASVTTVGDYAFYKCSSLTSVSMADGLTTIGEYAFSYCTSLTSVDIPDTVTTIEGRAFENCTALSNVYIPAELQHAAVTYTNGTKSYGIFNGCTNLRRITFEEGTDWIHAGLFAGSGIRTITLPETVTGIGAYAFSNCPSLKTVIMPEGMTTIKDYAFSYSTQLRNAAIPSTVTAMGQYLFYNCTALTKVDLSEGLTSLGTYAFAYSGITEIDMPSTMTTIPEYCFYNCDSLTTVTIPAEITSFGAYAFQDCDGLSTVNFEEGLQTIGNYTFYDCDALTSIVIPASVTTIGSNAFRYSGALESVTMQAGLTTIGDYAFANCEKLKSIMVPGTVTSIGENTFRDIAVVTAGPIGGGYDYEFAWTESIPNNAFRKISSLTSVVIPEGVKSIGTYAFTNSGVVNVSLPSTLSKLSNDCFYNSDSLTSITLPASLTTLGNEVFYDCDALDTVTFSEGLQTIGSYAFYDCNALTAVTIPASVTSIGTYAFRYNDALATVIMQDGLTSIGKYAFANCTSLKNFTVPGTVTSIGDYAFSGIATVSAGPIGGGYDYEFGWTENIPNNAFRRIGNLQSAVVPEGVTSVGTYAFANSGLKTVSLPNTLTTLGESCFNNCDNLSSMTMPSSLTTIGREIFYDCDALATVTFNEGLKSISNYAFYDCDAITIIDLPQSITSIGSNAFRSNDKLTTVTMRDGVTSIDSYVFDGCANLKSIKIPATVNSFGSYVFTGTALTTAGPIGGGYDYEFGWSTSIPNRAFERMSNLINVTLPEGITTIGSEAFENSGITSINLPKTLETLSSNCFDNCDNLTSIELPAALKKIEMNAFSSCEKLETVTMQNGVTSIGKYAFSNCSALKRITIPSTVSSVGDYAFSGTAIKTAGPIGGGYDYEFGWTESIPANAFRRLSKLVSVVVPDTVSAIGSNAFGGCSSSLVFYCSDDSYAATYAEEYGFSHRAS